MVISLWLRLFLAHAVYSAVLTMCGNVEMDDCGHNTPHLAFCSNDGLTYTEATPSGSLQSLLGVISGFANEFNTDTASGFHIGRTAL